MTVLSALRDRISTSESAAVPRPAMDGGPVARAELPFAGYDRLDASR